MSLKDLRKRFPYDFTDDTSHTHLSYKIIEKVNYKYMQVVPYQLPTTKKGEGQNDSKALNNLRRARRTIIDIVNNNITVYSSFITLTYAENMQDYEKAYNDFMRFIRKTKIKYLMVKELQKRGAIHFHVLAFTHITKEQVEKAWFHGFIHHKEIDDLSNIGSIGYYMGKYMADFNKNTLIEKNKRLYNCSRGLNRTNKKVATSKEIKEYKNTHDYKLETKHGDKYIKIKK